MFSMNRPSRGDRLSAATTRYVGCFFFPIRIRRSFTATSVFLGRFRPCQSNSSVELRPARRPLGGDPATLLSLLALAAHHPAEAHLAHHALHVLELLQQQVDLGGGRPAAVGDPEPPRPVDDLRGPALLP